MKKIITLFFGMAMAMGFASKMQAQVNNDCVITSFPYSETFSSNPSCWQGASGYSNWTWSSAKMNVTLYGSTQAVLLTPAISTPGTYTIVWTTSVQGSSSDAMLSLHPYFRDLGYLNSTSSIEGFALNSGSVVSSRRDTATFTVTNDSWGPTCVAFVASCFNLSSGSIQVSIDDVVITSGGGGEATSCIIEEFPYTENFDGEAACWEVYDPDNDATEDGMNAWFFFEEVGVNNSTCVGIANNNNSPDYGLDYLFSPYIVTPGTYNVSYKVRCSSSGRVYYATWPRFSVAEPIDIEIDSVADSNWVTKNYTFTLNASDTAYLTFAYATAGGPYLLLDDITISRQDSASTQYTLTVNSNNSAWGSVSGGGTYNQGATATLTATPNSGYRFVRWQDNNTDNPRTVTVTDDASYTAYFEEEVGIDDAAWEGIEVALQGCALTIHGATGEPVTITDLMGRCLYSARATESTHVALPSAGVYFVRVGDRPARKVVAARR